MCMTATATNIIKRLRIMSQWVWHIGWKSFNFQLSSNSFRPSPPDCNHNTEDNTYRMGIRVQELSLMSKTVYLRWGATNLTGLSPWTWSGGSVEDWRRCCFRRGACWSHRGDAGEHLAEHLKHVQLSRVLNFSATVFCLQALFLHAIEIVLSLCTLFQELLH